MAEMIWLVPLIPLLSSVLLDAGLGEFSTAVDRVLWGWLRGAVLHF